MQLYFLLLNSTIFRPITAPLLSNLIPTLDSRTYNYKGHHGYSCYSWNEVADWGGGGGICYSYESLPTHVFPHT